MNQKEGEEEPVPDQITKIERKRKLLTADSEIEISKKDYSSHLKDTSSILKKQRFLPRYASIMTLLEARMTGHLGDSIFFPSTIHPDLRAMLNPESLRRLDKRKAEDSTLARQSPKKARVVEPEVLQEEGFGDGGFGDGGFGDTFGGGDGFAGDDYGFGGEPIQDLPEPERRVSPSLVDEDAAHMQEEEEAPTSVTGSMSHSTLAAAHLLQKELAPHASSTLHELTEKSIPSGKVRREDAVKMFFEVLVLASRDVIRVEQKGGFAEINVLGKDTLFSSKGFGSTQQQIVV